LLALFLANPLLYGLVELDDMRMVQFCKELCLFLEDGGKQLRRICIVFGGEFDGVVAVIMVS
jgi:hypothetical protein